MRVLIAVLFLVVLTTSWQALGATVFKCVDAAGKITFTQHDCPAASQDSSVVSVSNQRPSGAGPATMMADPSKLPPPRREARRLTVVQEPEVALEEPIQAERPRAVAQQKPCVRYVQKLVNTSRITKEGKRRGRSELIKVPVPC